MTEKVYGYRILKGQMAHYKIAISNAIVAAWFDGQETQHNDTKEGKFRVNRKYLPHIKSCLKHLVPVIMNRSMSIQSGNKAVRNLQKKSPSCSVTLSYKAPTTTSPKWNTFFMRRLAMLFWPYEPAKKGFHGRSVGRGYFDSIIKDPVLFNSFIPIFFQELDKKLNVKKFRDVPYVDNINEFRKLIDAVQKETCSIIGLGIAKQFKSIPNYKSYQRTI
tara:strand:- start:467 stop:1120 length:654 start_codon:yes stop_codon:yes gene_type:complete